MLDQAESWLAPLRAPAADRRPLGERALGELTALERRLVALSAVAVQEPQLVVVEEPDRDLGTAELSWLAGVCAELVHDTGTTVLLVGSRVTALADQPTMVAKPPVEVPDEPPVDLSEPAPLPDDELAGDEQAQEEPPPTGRTTDVRNQGGQAEVEPAEDSETEAREEQTHELT